MQRVSNHGLWGRIEAFFGLVYPQPFTFFDDLHFDDLERFGVGLHQFSWVLWQVERLVKIQVKIRENALFVYIVCLQSSAVCLWFSAFVYLLEMFVYEIQLFVYKLQLYVYSACLRTSVVCLHSSAVYLHCKLFVYIAQLFIYNFRLFGLCLLCLLPSTGPSWWPAISALPFAIWYLKRLYKVPTGNSGLYEPTEIRQRLFLRFSIRETIAFLVFHSLAFFGLLFALAATLSLTEEVPWWKTRQNGEV